MSPTTFACFELYYDRPQKHGIAVDCMKSWPCHTKYPRKLMCKELCVWGSSNSLHAISSLKPEILLGPWHTLMAPDICFRYRYHKYAPKRMSLRSELQCRVTVSASVYWGFPQGILTLCTSITVTNSFKKRDILYLFHQHLVSQVIITTINDKQFSHVISSTEARITQPQLVLLTPRLARS